MLKRWKPPKTYLKDLGVGAAGFALAFVASMDGVAWFTLPAYVSASFHLLLIIIVLTCLRMYIRRWGSLHSNSIPSTTSPAISALPVFQSLDLDEKAKLVLSAAEQWVLDHLELLRLADDLIATSQRRARVTERIEINGRVATHEVAIEVRNLPTVRMNGGVAFLLLRPLRGASQGYSELVVRNERDEILNAMPYVDGAALSYMVVSAVADDLHIQNSSLKRKAQRQLAELVFANYSAPELIEPLLTTLIQTANLALSPKAQHQLRELVQLLSARRPMYVFTAHSGAPSEQLRLTYSVNLGRSFASYSTEWWRERKDTLRSTLRYPPKLLQLNLDRSRSAESYQLYIRAPKGLYFDEVGVFNDVDDELRGWVKPLKRESLHGAYIGWEQPSGKETTSLGTRNLSLAGLKNAVFCMRFAEVPPGTLGGATIVAFSVLIAAWIAGAMAPEENIDIVAFIIAFPGVLSSWVGLSPSRSIDRGFRSLSAALSLILSVAISVSSVTLYLSRHAAQQTLVSTNFPKGKTVLFVNDYLWLLLLLAAFANLAIVGGTLAMRVKRYHKLLAGS